MEGFFTLVSLATSTLFLVSLPSPTHTIHNFPGICGVIQSFDGHDAMADFEALLDPLLALIVLTAASILLLKLDEPSEL